MKKLRIFDFVSIFVVIICIILGSSPVFSAASTSKVTLPDLSKAQWLTLGPFANEPAESSWSECQGFDRDYLASIGGEAKAQFSKDQNIAGRIVTPSKAEKGVVDFHNLYPSSVNTVAYAFLELSSMRQQKVALKLGSDDGIKVWCNGQLIWSNHDHRPLTPEEDAVALPLKSGKNRLLVKVDQGNGGWGFSARIRSLANEADDWAKVKSPGYRVILPNPMIPQGNQAWCIVNTIPAMVVSEPVKLIVGDALGKEVFSRDGVIGEPISFNLPPELKGVIHLQAVGTGKHAAFKSQTILAIVGDVKEVTQETIALARQVSDELTETANSEDLGATLTFLADQLEGKVHSSLATPERNLRAIGSIYEIEQLLQKGPWQVASMRGTRQWAYRSVIDDSCQPYTVYLPETYDPQKKYSLIITLHGYGGDDYQAAKKLGDLRPEDFIIAGAFGRGDMGYRSIGEQDILDLRKRLAEIYSIDPDRVYLMGESMGGMGTWRIGQFFADRFAAMATFCGWTGVEYLENLKNLPVLIVHGDKDSTVPVGMDRAAALQLQKLGYVYRYDELPGVEHNAWDAWAQAKGGNHIFEYFREYRRNPWPTAISLKINYLRYGRQYWVGIKELTQPSGKGEIHAVVVNSREVNIETNGISTFMLDLCHPGLEQTGEIKIIIDNHQLTVSAGEANTIFNYQKEGGWSAGIETQSEIAPHLGGGLADLFTEPITIVYGTVRPERREILQMAAERIADWTPIPQIAVGSKVGHFQIKADTEVTENEIRSRNLFFIGSANENLIVANLMAKLVDKLAVKMNGDDVIINSQEFKNSGLVLVCPNPQAPSHLIGILTLPFPKESVEGFIRYANVPFRGYNVDGSAIDCYTMPDVVIIKSFAESPINFWSFDRNWDQLIPFNNNQ